MMKASIRILSSHIMRAVAGLTICGALAVIINLAAPSTAFADRPKKPPAKNIIIMISDGLGFNHLEATRYYQYGEDAPQIFNRFPINYAMSTYMAYREENGPCNDGEYDPELAWSVFDYVKTCSTDSAAAATAMSTGVKTYQGAIGVDLADQPLVHSLELAEHNSKMTGVVTSVEWSYVNKNGQTNIRAAWIRGSNAGEASIFEISRKPPPTAPTTPTSTVVIIDF